RRGGSLYTGQTTPSSIAYNSRAERDSEQGAQIMRRMAIAAVLVALFALPALAQNRSQGTPTRVRGVVNKLDGQTLTPIQHLVVIFQENVSFDHYFGTYPTALNPPGEPRVQGEPGHADGQRAWHPRRRSARRRPANP